MIVFEDWFKLKKYPHIGLPITSKDYLWVKKYVENVDKVRVHSFLPLIHKSIVTRKFRADKLNLEKNPSGKRKRIKGKPKVRDIFFSSHLDSLIFSKYNEKLSKAYNEYLKNTNFKDSIVAYRKIPIYQNSKKNKCNIDFAKSSFEFIKSKSPHPVTVIIADITSFFDNLNHDILKKQWANILNVKNLSKDHYNIFRALTNIKYVDGEQLFESYDKTMIFEKGLPNQHLKKRIVRKKINGSQFFKEKSALAYCTKKEFLRNNLSLIISKNNSVGIPQGSPISATLANIYMIDFDKYIYDKISSIGGFYQRYSDDLILIFEQKYESEIIDSLLKSIKDIVKLDIETSKTKLYHFQNINCQYVGFEVNLETKEPNFNKALEYLGFSFDGQKVLIKKAGFSKFYRSMKASFKKSTSLAINSKNPDKRIFTKRLYKRFTYIGAQRKQIYRPSFKDNKKYIKTAKYYWGNYLSYVNKSNDSMKSINRDDSIKKQGKRIWRNFHKLMRFHQKRIALKVLAKR